MNCPKCKKRIGLRKIASNNFHCSACNTQLSVSGNFRAHLFASALFVFEAFLLFAFVKVIWVAVVSISLMAVVNYYLGFRLFLRVKARSAAEQMTKE